MGFARGLPIVRSSGQTIEEARRERQILNMRALRKNRKITAQTPDYVPLVLPTARPKKLNNILDLVSLRG